MLLSKHALHFNLIYYTKELSPVNKIESLVPITGATTLEMLELISIIFLHLIYSEVAEVKQLSWTAFLGLFLTKFGFI